MNDGRLNIAIILALAFFVSILSTPVWPGQIDLDGRVGEDSCRLASTQLGVPIIRDLTPREVVLVARVNLVRRQNGLPPLAYAGDGARKVARLHSERMLEVGFFAHRDDYGDTAGTRLSRSGVDWRVVGENLLEETGAPSTDAVVADAVDAWFRSPDHRANILDETYTETAVGIASRDGHTYLTQLFIAR